MAENQPHEPLRANSTSTKSNDYSGSSLAVFTASEEPKEAPPTSKEGFKAKFQQQVQKYRVEIDHAWKTKDVKQIWYYAMHTLGFISYTVIVLFLSCTLGVAFLLLNTQTRTEKERQANKQPDVSETYFEFLENLLMFIYVLFARLFGWPHDVKPWRVPFTIIGTITTKLRPNATTQFIGYATLAYGAFWLVTNSGLVMFKIRQMFGATPEYY